MALQARLTVTSDKGQSLGSNASHDFGATGGFIGRSGACEWCLPDPTHTLSARHAEIRFNGQGFVVIDLSTNGVYINTTDAPIGRGNTAVLVNGDQIYIGPYVLAVEIAKVADDAAPVRPAPDPRALTPLGQPSVAAQPMFRAPPSPPQPPNTTFRAPLDPLAALDGADALDHHTDNPFSDIGIGRRSKDLTDSGLRNLTGFRAAPSTPPYSAPAHPPPPPRPVSYPPMPAAVPARPRGGAGSVIPADFDLSAPPPQPAETSIPPDFLEELSVLIPRLAEGSASAPPAAAAPLELPPALVPPPQFAPPAHQLSPDDPEDMVTMLRMRAKAKAADAQGAPPPARAHPFRPAAPSQPTAALHPPPVMQQKPLPSPRTHATEADFWALLGVDPAGLSQAERDRLLGESAGLIRALMEGLIALQAVRRSLKGELHLEATQLAADGNPFKTALSPEEALSQSIGAGSEGRVEPGAAVHAVFNEMRIHEMASMEAMQATIARLMQRISPAAIAFELEGEAPSGGMFARKADKMKLWDRYLLMHERLVDALDVISPELIGEEFSRAYAKHAETLRRGTA